MSFQTGVGLSLLAVLALVWFGAQLLERHVRARRDALLKDWRGRLRAGEEVIWCPRGGTARLAKIDYVYLDGKHADITLRVHREDLLPVGEGE